MKKILIPLLLIGLITAGCVSDDVRGARDGDLQAVKDFVSGGGDVNERKNQGMTLLMYASAGGHVPVIDYLMAQGADLSLRDDRGYTAFLHGAAAGKNNSLESLLSYGARLGDRDNGGNTALITAVSQDNSSTASFLLDRGIDVGTANNRGYTALLAALDRSASLPAGFSSTFSLLQDRGAGFSPSDGPVRDIAFKAARTGNRDVLSLLFDRGFDGSARNGSGESLLHAGVGHSPMTEYLLFMGQEVNSVDNKNQTPLMAAVILGDGESVSLLLRNGARTDIRNRNGRTALLLASEMGNLEILRSLLLSGADVYATDGKGNTALHFAAQKGTPDTVRLLLTAGIFVNSANGEGKTPYDLSFQNVDRGEEIRAVLLTAGAVVPLTAQPQSPTEAPPAAEVPESTQPQAQQPLPGQTLAGRKSGAGLSGGGAIGGTNPSATGTTPAAPAEPVPPAAVSVTSLALSWPMVNPSKARGWNNRDKLTGQGRFVLSYGREGAPDYAEEYDFPLQGVNLKEGSRTWEVLWNGAEAVTVKMILDTSQGRHLIGELPRGGETGSGPVRFETFRYE